VEEFTSSFVWLLISGVDGVCHEEASLIAPARYHAALQQFVEGLPDAASRK
jgi:hypothetical protein